MYLNISIQQPDHNKAAIYSPALNSRRPTVSSRSRIKYIITNSPDAQQRKLTLMHLDALTSSPEVLFLNTQLLPGPSVGRCKPLCIALIPSNILLYFFFSHKNRRIGTSFPFSKNRYKRAHWYRDALPRATETQPSAYMPRKKIPRGQREKQYRIADKRDAYLSTFFLTVLLLLQQLLLLPLSSGGSRWVFVFFFLDLYRELI